MCLIRRILPAQSLLRQHIADELHELYTTRTGNIFQNRFAYTVLNVLVNIVRPIPFIILIAALGPLTSAVVQTRLGINAAIFAMTFGASFAIARIVEQNMVSIDPGVIEAAARWAPPSCGFSSP